MLSLEAVLYSELQVVEKSAVEAYSDIFQFGSGLTQNSTDQNDGSYIGNPVAYWRNSDSDTGHFRIMFADQFSELLEELQTADFAILNGLSYLGRRNVQKNANKMFAMIFDLDGVTEKSLRAFCSGCKGVYPMPNYIILSGHGLHLYYVFSEPIELRPYMKLQLKELKYQLTRQIWNQYTSIEDKPQFQGINQSFRVIGGKTKIDGVRLRAFATGKEIGRAHV